MNPSSPSGRPLSHPIGVVVRRTGLKPDLIRAWERRYGAIEPVRTDTNRRRYTDADVARLGLLRDAVAGGRSIGQIADLPDAELEELIAADLEAARRSPAAAAAAAPGDPRADSAEELVTAALEAVGRLDGRALEATLERAALVLGQPRLAEEVIVPMMRRIGELWKEGTLRPAHEHLTSAAVRTFVGGLHRRSPAAPEAPALVVTTPAGQRHELGALLAASAAATEGWRVAYLGADLPAEDIAAAARIRGARGVALSITFPPDDPFLAGELERLRRLVGDGVELIAGGRSAAAYGPALDGAGFTVLERVSELRERLEALRAAAGSAPSSRD